MKFQVGDPVLLKQTGHSGKIVGIEQEGMYLVAIGNAAIPVFESDMDHPYFDWFTNEKDKKKKLKWVTAEQIPLEQPKASIQHQPGLYLGFFPHYETINKEEKIQYFKLYLINQEKTGFRFHYKMKIQQQKQAEFKGNVWAFANFYLHNVSMDEMHLQPLFQLELYKESTSGLRETTELKIKPKKLFEYLLELEQEGKAFFQVPLVLEQDAIPEKQMEAIGLSKIESQHSLFSNKFQTEIDLHIEKLVKDYHHLSNAEIIEIQMAAFHKAMDKAEHSGQSALTVIHGVGKGVLKANIHQELRQNPKVRQFISDWMPKYGFGATQVFFL